MPMTAPPPHTVLVLGDRGALPFKALHGEPVYLHALRALVEAFPVEAIVTVDTDQEARVRAEVETLDLQARIVNGDAWWTEVTVSTARDLLLHDSLCPLASVEFLRDMRDRAAGRPECSFIAFRPVTDTVKTVVDEQIQGTIDRGGLAALTSPAVLSASMLAGATKTHRRPPLADFAQLVTWLRDLGDVELVKAPSLARRVEDASAVNLLECLDEVARRVRIEPGAPRLSHPPFNGGSGTRTP